MRCFFGLGLCGGITAARFDGNHPRTTPKTVPSIVLASSPIEAVHPLDLLRKICGRRDCANRERGQPSGSASERRRASGHPQLQITHHPTAAKPSPKVSCPRVLLRRVEARVSKLKIVFEAMPKEADLARPEGLREEERSNCR
eukprot:scaffold1557_cov246-Pinguiococcus_pyrenoidosus.AAC.26